MRCIYTQTLENGDFHKSVLFIHHDYQPHTVPVAKHVHTWVATVLCEVLLLAAYRSVVRGRSFHGSNDAQLCAQCGDHLGTVLQVCLNPEELGYQW